MNSQVGDGGDDGWACLDTRSSESVRAAMTPGIARLHVAALPFPTRQGTQALVRSMLECEVAAGHDSQLLTYAAAGYPYAPSFPLHRCADMPRVRSLRSGPSLGKLALDLQLIRALRRLLPRLRPRFVVAHHVEAALAVAAVCRGPWCFVAHTDLAAELPDYVAAPLRPPISWLGAGVDRRLLRCAPVVAAVSPLLARGMTQRRPATRGIVHYLPPPQPSPAPAPAMGLARRQLGLPQDAWVMLYAGNLDRYQGVERLLEVLVKLREAAVRAHLLLATASSSSALIEHSRRLGVAEQVQVVALGDERARAQLHAAADLGLIVRRTAGGVPIKLLDGLSRGLPMVLGPTAAAGLPLSRVCALAEDDSAEALCAQVLRLLREPQRLTTFSAAGRDYIARCHSSAAYLIALHRALRVAL